MNLQIELTDSQIEEIARRAVELLPATEEDGWLSVVETAEYLRCPKSRVYSLVSAGRMPFVKDGRRTLFRRSELDTWLRAGGGIRP